VSAYLIRRLATSVVVVLGVSLFADPRIWLA